MRNKIPPPILLLITGAIMWIVARSTIAYKVSVPYPLALSLCLAAIGVLISVLALREFRKVQTTINPLAPDSATSLVKSGIFGYSRNPMYVGLLFLSAGWAVWLGSQANIVVVLLFVVLITELQIKPEERALRKLFGEGYDQYCQRVRRWF